MTVLPTLRADLVAQAGRLADGHERRRRRRRVAIGVATAALGVGTAAAAASSIWAPQVGDDRRGHPTVSRLPVPAQEQRLLGVLRRAPTTDDRGAEVQQALRFVGPQVQGVRTEQVRLLARMPDGRPVVLVPAAAGYGRRDVLCLYAADVDGGGLTCPDVEQLQRGEATLGLAVPLPESAATVRRRAAFLRSHPAGRGHAVELPDDLAPRFGGALQIGLVPDGVASVRLGTAPDAPRAAVHDNAYVLALPAQRPTPGVPQLATPTAWFDARGRPVHHG